MFLLQQILPGMLVAALIAGGLLALAGWLWKKNVWAAALSLGLGYAGGHAVTTGLPAFPPSDATYWLFYFAFAGIIVAIVVSRLSLPAWLRAGIWLLVCAMLLRVLLQAKFQSGWTLFQGILWIAALAAGMLLLGWCMERFTQKDLPSFSLPLVLTVISGGTSAALMLSGSMLLGEFGTVLSAAIGAGFIVSWWLGSDRMAMRGIVPVSILLLAGLWISGYFYAELPAISALIFAAASFLTLIPLRVGWSSWRIAVVYAVLVAVPIAVAVLIAWRASPPMDY